jgi:hypothetical protein
MEVCLSFVINRKLHSQTLSHQNSTFFILLPHPTKTIEEILICTTIQQKKFLELDVAA